MTNFAKVLILASVLGLAAVAQGVQPDKQCYDPAMVNNPLVQALEKVGNEKVHKTLNPENLVAKLQSCVVRDTGGHQVLVATLQLVRHANDPANPGKNIRTELPITTQLLLDSAAPSEQTTQDINKAIDSLKAKLASQQKRSA
jgi:hypothetical protein